MGANSHENGGRCYSPPIPTASRIIPVYMASSLGHSQASLTCKLQVLMFGEEGLSQVPVREGEYQEVPLRGCPPTPALTAQGRELLASVLGTLQVLQDPGQLHTCLPPLADTPEFALHSPGDRKEKERDGSQESIRSYPITHPPPRLPRPGRLSRAVLSLFIKHHDLIHTINGTGPGHLASQVGTELWRLGIVQDGAREGHAQRIGPS